MKEALNRAIEAGYDLKKGIGWPPKLGSWPELEEIAYNIYPQLIREDPLFWQALSKAEEWVYIGPYHKTPWETEWYSFIDHLIAGKDTESFFTALLTPKL